MKLPIRLSNGVEVIAHVLVDDGAKLVLVRSGFNYNISDQLWQKPEQKVNLMGANQTLLGGGSRGCLLDLKFLRQRLDGRFSGTKYFSTLAYEADINLDIYIENPFLFDHKIAPFAHRGNFFHDQGEGSWLRPWRESPQALMDYVSEYCPPELHESLRNSLVDKRLAGKSLSAVQALGELDLEPYVPEMDMARPPTKQQFSSSIAAKKNVMPTGCSSYKLTMYRDCDTRVVAKRCPAKGKKGWPQLDVFGSRGARVVEREDGKPARLVKDPYNMSWMRQFLWILAPWEHMDRVLYKLAEDKARAIVVVQNWVHRKWW